MIKKSFFVFFLITYLSGCEFVKTHSKERSFSIDESSKKKVFISEFKPSKNIISFRNGISFEFEQIWSEYPWWYINQNKKIEIIDKTNTVLLFKFKDFSNAELNSNGIRIGSDCCQYSGFNGMFYRLEDVNELDHINLNIYLVEDKDPSKNIDSVKISLERLKELQFNKK